MPTQPFRQALLGGPSEPVHASIDIAPTGSRLTRERVRGDGDSFIARARRTSIEPAGDEPVASAVRNQAEVVVVVGQNGETQCSVDGCDVQQEFSRAADLPEFGIRSIHFVPVEGGVFEYGVSG